MGLFVGIKWDRGCEALRRAPASERTLNKYLIIFPTLSRYLFQVYVTLVKKEMESWEEPKPVVSGQSSCAIITYCLTLRLWLQGTWTPCAAKAQRWFPMSQVRLSGNRSGLRAWARVIYQESSLVKGFSGREAESPSSPHKASTNLSGARAQVLSVRIVLLHTKMPGPVLPPRLVPRWGLPWEGPDLSGGR